MKRLATLLGVAIMIGVASQAFAVDLHNSHRTGTIGNPTSPRQNHTFSVQTIVGCDDGYLWSSWYQNADDRLGNLFDFGTGAQLSTVAFYHYGWGFSGPYQYDLEVWDPVSCTQVATVAAGLTALDAAASSVVEVVNACPSDLHFTGVMMVGIHPLTCISATDCYPDLVYDDQTDVFCPVIIGNASTSPVCYDVSANAGPFVFRCELDNCPVPAKRATWGQLKSSYR